MRKLFCPGELFVDPELRPHPGTAMLFYSPLIEDCAVASTSSSLEDESNK